MKSRSGVSLALVQRRRWLTLRQFRLECHVLRCRLLPARSRWTSQWGRRAAGAAGTPPVAAKYSHQTSTPAEEQVFSSSSATFSTPPKSAEHPPRMHTRNTFTKKKHQYDCAALICVYMSCNCFSRIALYLLCTSTVSRRIKLLNGTAVATSHSSSVSWRHKLVHT